MCIRFDQLTGQPIRWSRMVKEWVPLEDWTVGLDTFPGYVAPIIVPDWDKNLRVKKAQWGMIPPWANDARYGKKNAYNARSETVLEKPTFREAFQKRRCVVPASAFYERMGGRWIRFASPDPEEPLAIAGLFQPPNRWSEVPSFALLTTDPNETVAKVQDRMPVILESGDLEMWLSEETDPAELRSLLIASPPEKLTSEDAGPIETRRKASVGQKTLFDDSPGN